MLVVAAIVILVLLVLGVSMVSAVTSAKDENTSARIQLKRLYLAESGLDAALLDLATGGTGDLGSSTTPLSFGEGAYWTATTDHGDDTYTVVARGRYQDGTRVLQGRVRKSTPVFHHAVFAGNSSGDLTYTMDFGGDGAQGDVINGNVFSGGNVNVWGDATITGEVRAQGTITGAAGTEGISQPGFDFRGIDLSGPDVVDVVAEFAAEGYAASDDAGGTADQVPQTNPAHIFRRNPSDRTTETSGTVKDDYFLEDPYEVVGVDPNDDGTDPYMVTIDDGTGTTRRVYYIDGNLWIHNRPSLSFMLQTSAGTGVQVTIIVRGNITLSDSVRMQDPDLDALALVALSDPDVADSGNVYLGDPVGGTLKVLESYLYAENDFLDVNLDASGSKEVTLRGAMTAGNQVNIQRTFEGQHSRLTVNWDPRLQTGDVTLPLISTDVPESQYVLEAWVERPPGS